MVEPEIEHSPPPSRELPPSGCYFMNICSMTPGRNEPHHEKQQQRILIQESWTQWTQNRSENQWSTARYTNSRSTAGRKSVDQHTDVSHMLDSLKRREAGGSTRQHHPIPHEYVLGSHVGVSCVTVSWWRGSVTVSTALAASSQVCTVIPSVVTTRVLVRLVITSVIVLLVHAATEQGHHWLTAMSQRAPEIWGCDCTNVRPGSQAPFWSTFIYPVDGGSMVFHSTGTFPPSYMQLQLTRQHNFRPHTLINRI
jgi:hypothetical protein